MSSRREQEGPVPRDALPAPTARLLRELLAGQGVTQREIAAELGVTETTVSRWLARTHPMPLGVLRWLARRLDVPLYTLLGGPPPFSDTTAIVSAMRAQLDGLTRAVRESMRLMPVYREGDAGDPRGDDPAAGVEAATPTGYMQVLPGHERAVGPRGYAVAVGHDGLAGRGVWTGDLCFANPDQTADLGSLLIARIAGHVRLCELAPGPDGRLLYRTAPLSGPPESWPVPTHPPCGLVLRVVHVARLKHGLGNADDRPAAGAEGPPEGVRYDIGESHGHGGDDGGEDGVARHPAPIHTER